MQELNEYQKWLVIESAMAEYNSSTILYTSPESRSLLKALSSAELDLNYKWYLLKCYLADPNNRFRTFASILNDAIQAAAVPPLDIGPVRIGRYYEQDLFTLFSVPTKQEILKKIFQTKDFSYKSRELYQYLCASHNLNLEADLAAKWECVITYLRDRNNQHLPLYQMLVETITNHDPAKDLIYNGDFYLEQARQSGGIHNEYYFALFYYTQIYKPSLTTTAKVAECEFGVGAYEAAFEHYSQVASKDSRYAPMRDAALDAMLRQGTYKNYMVNQPRNGAFSHSFHHFASPVRKGAGNEFAEVMCTLSILCTCASIINPVMLIPATLLLLTTGAAMVLGAAGGSVVGFFRAESRHPLNVQQQDELIAKLQTSSRLPAANKQYIIDNIVSEYRSTKTLAASGKSLELYKQLSGTLPVEQKWQKLEYYMLQRKDDLFQNNGKRLFSIIDRALPSPEACQTQLKLA